jgi:hypothetical protein
MFSRIGNGIRTGDADAIETQRTGLIRERGSQRVSGGISLFAH